MKVLAALLITALGATGGSFLWLAYVEAVEDLDQAVDDQKVIRRELEESSREVGRLTAERNRIRNLRDQSAQAVEALTSERDEAWAQISQTRVQYQELEERTDATATQLRSQIQELENRVSRLQPTPNPVIRVSTRTETGWFRCTASMEPAITCLDTATWQMEFDESDVDVGTIISFSSDACWEDRTGRHTVHRVYEINDFSTPTTYLPKGDADTITDCWITIDDIRGIVLEVHKNTRTANAPLRDAVREAKAATKRHMRSTRETIGITMWLGGKSNQHGTTMVAGTTTPCSRSTRRISRTHASGLAPRYIIPIPKLQSVGRPTATATQNQT